eukprot:CAMPEP_0113481150 /NCGR_PEP_ID=MMETSP0014_2-20120614/22258_1 /TAXON_ID=2857 /ORGANISM="Nitzschia sp." /LENGTH=1039 /DNA_ID=CAMNT_0000374633 /DNA_START=156 /DNA_END=3275 /DNA_ORIENTATION=+ /assembly_acc=CAM_ASM_000159
MKFATSSFSLFLLAVATTTTSVHGKERGTNGAEGGSHSIRAVRGGTNRRTKTKLSSSSSNIQVTGDQKFDVQSLRRQLDEQITRPLMTSGHGRRVTRRMNGVSAAPSSSPSMAPSSGKGKKGGKGKKKEDDEIERDCEVEIDIVTCIDEEDCTECADFDRSKCERTVAIQYTITSPQGSSGKGGKGKGNSFTVRTITETFAPFGSTTMDPLCPIVEETHEPLDFVFPGPGESLTVTKKYDINICKCPNFVFSAGAGAFAFPGGELGTCIALEGELYQTLPAITDPEDCTEERVISPLARDVTGEEAFCVEEQPDPVPPSTRRALQGNPLVGGPNAYAWANDFNEECGVGFIVNSRGTVGLVGNDPSEPSITVRNAFGDVLFEGFLTAADFPESSPNLGVRAGLVVGCKVDEGGCLESVQIVLGVIGTDVLPDRRRLDAGVTNQFLKLNLDLTDSGNPSLTKLGILALPDGDGAVRNMRRRVDRPCDFVYSGDLQPENGVDSILRVVDFCDDSDFRTACGDDLDIIASFSVPPPGQPIPNTGTSIIQRDGETRLAVFCFAWEIKCDPDPSRDICWLDLLCGDIPLPSQAPSSAPSTSSAPSAEPSTTSSLSTSLAPSAVPTASPAPTTTVERIGDLIDQIQMAREALLIQLGTLVDGVETLNDQGIELEPYFYSVKRTDFDQLCSNTPLRTGCSPITDPIPLSPTSTGLDFDVNAAIVSTLPLQFNGQEDRVMVCSMSGFVFYGLLLTDLGPGAGPTRRADLDGPLGRTDAAMLRLLPEFSIFLQLLDVIAAGLPAVGLILELRDQLLGLVELGTQQECRICGSESGCDKKVTVPDQTNASAYIWQVEECGDYIFAGSLDLSGVIRSFVQILAALIGDAIGNQIGLLITMLDLPSVPPQIADFVDDQLNLIDSLPVTARDVVRETITGLIATFIFDARNPAIRPDDFGFDLWQMSVDEANDPSPEFELITKNGFKKNKFSPEPTDDGVRSLSCLKPICGGHETLLVGSAVYYGGQDATTWALNADAEKDCDGGPVCPALM